MAAPKIKYTKTDPSRVTWLEQKDLFKRAVGYWPDAATSKVFYLGSNENEAKSRSLKLDQLWREFASKGHKTWTIETLEAAQAVAKGAKRVELEPVRIGGGFNVDGFNPNHIAEDSYNEGRAEAIENSVIPVVVAQPAAKFRTGTSLHKTIEAYAVWVEKVTLIPGTKTTSPYGHTNAGAVRRLVDSYPDCPLNQIGYLQIEEMARYWITRPARKGTAKPISADTVKNMVSTLRRFVKWASKHAGFRKPEDWMDATKYSKKNLATAAEKAARATRHSVKTYTLTELEMIWRHATKWERTLLVLALNCGFGAAEISTLRLDEVHLSETKIRRIRGKSGVYGEHELWPETVELLKWAIERRKDIGKTKLTDFVMVRETGEPLVTLTEAGNTSNKVAQSWYDVLVKISRTVEGFKRLSFKHFRKTAANFVRKASDGETSAIFLHHGQAVAEDALAEVYSDRDFEKLFAAQLKVRTALASMFAQPLWCRGEDRGDQIKRMRKDGKDARAIAAELHTSMATIYRHLNAA